MDQAIGSTVFPTNGKGNVLMTFPSYLTKTQRWYVVAMLSTHHRTVYIKHDGKRVKTLPFPFAEQLPIDVLTAAN